MKSMIIMLLGAVCLLTVNSCNKTSTSAASGVGGASGQLKSLTQVVTSGSQTDSIVTTFTYDSQNRVSKQIAVTNIGGSILGSDTTTYSYFTDSIIQNIAGNIAIYYLNSDGYRTSDNLGDTWTYSSDGYLLSSLLVVLGSNTIHTSYTYNSSDQLTSKATAEIVLGVTTTDTDSYSYTSNTINSPSSSWGTGKSAGAFWSTDVNIKAGVTTTFTNTYVTDSQNRLIKTTTVSSASSSTPVVTYYAYY